MSHPFEKIFEKALVSSTHDNNVVFREATKLQEKGYLSSEILEVLVHLQKALIDERESSIVKEAALLFEENM